MVQYPSSFTAALDKQIRDIGRCYIKLTFSDTSTYEIDEYKVEKLTITAKNDPLSRRFPTESATLVLLDFDESWHPDAPNSIMQKLEEKASAEIKFGIDVNGSTVWGPTLNYFIVEKPTWNNYRATIKMVSRLCSLTGTFYHISSSLLRLSTLATDILTVGGDGGNHTYDTALNYYQVIEDASVPVCPVRDALLLVASASGSSIFTRNNGTIHIAQPYDNDIVKNPVVVKLDDMYERPVAQRLEPIRNEIVSIPRNAIIHPDRQEVLRYESNVLPDGSGHEFLEFETPVRVSSIEYAPASETNIVNSTFQSYKTGLVPIYIARVDNSQPYTIIVTGIPLAPRYEQKTYVVDANGVADDTFENPILDFLHSGGIATFRGGYLKNTKSLYSFTYRGDPTIEPLDFIRVELPHGGICVCIVLETTFTFGNGFSGSLVVRKLDVVDTDHEIVSGLSDLAVSDESVSDEES